MYCLKSSEPAMARKLLVSFIPKKPKGYLQTVMLSAIDELIKQKKYELIKDYAKRLNSENKTKVKKLKKHLGIK